MGNNNDDGQEFRFILCSMLAAIYSWYLVDPNSFTGYIRWFLSTIVLWIVFWSILKLLTK